ncbi:hypothetical protein BU16DRAFT_589353, partial [Lophium mytilinum]
GFITSAFVLTANVVCLVVFHVKYGSKSNRGVIPIYNGDCNWVKNAGIFSHICINILSTLLLGASNLCMQLLAAPTRDEVNRAHRKKVWLDIGAPSLRNLKYIAKSRRILWFCLGLSSIPIHFMYNSAISTSIPLYGYVTIVASENFLHGADIGNWTEITSAGVDPVRNRVPNIDTWNSSQEFEKIQANAPDISIFEKLSNRDCVEKYAKIYGARTSLVVITEALPEDRNASVHQYIFWPAKFDFGSRYNPCTGLYNLQEGDYQRTNPSCRHVSSNTQADYDNWHRFNRTVLYCLSEKLHGSHCSINYAPSIFLAICCFSTLKCVCILATLSHKQPTLSTLGDAIASFLEDPDDASAHMGPVTKVMFKSRKSRVWTEPSPLLWLPRPLRWYSGPSARRWIFTITVYTLAISGALASVIPGIHGTKARSGKGVSWEMKQNIGRADSDSFNGYSLPKYGTLAFIENVIWANMWQVILLLYIVAL